MFYLFVNATYFYLTNKKDRCKKGRAKEETHRVTVQYMHEFRNSVKNKRLHIARHNH
jgi:hypothetical protein